MLTERKRATESVSDRECERQRAHAGDSESERESEQKRPGVELVFYLL